MSQTQCLARAAFVVSLIAMGSLACKSNPIEPPTPENFARNWQLTKCEYRAKAGSARVDLIAQGWVINLLVGEDGRFTYFATPPGGVLQTIDGTWQASGHVVTMSPQGVGYQWSFTAKVQETSMTLDGASAEWDLNNDGTPEDVTWHMAGQTTT